MEESLLVPRELEEERKGVPVRTWDLFTQELKTLGYIAAPMVAVSLTQYLLQVFSLMMVGHLGELALSSTAIAMSLANVTGFSLMVGLASALETLCGQAYGAQQYRKLGTQTYTAVFCLVLVCIPLSLIWTYMGKILVIIGQDPVISHEAGKFIIWLIPSLFASALLQPLNRFFQSQSLIIPISLFACVTLCIHAPLCWALVLKLGLGNLGAAVAMCISNWLNVIFLGLYMKYSPSCINTRAPVSVELFSGIREFFQFAVPTAIMICLEWWSFELLVLLSGLLPNPQLEASVLSVCLTTIATLYSMPYGIGAAVSTRISNELGAGNPQAARIAYYAAMFIGLADATIIIIAVISTRHIFGYMFSDEKEVVDYVTTMTPLICCSVFMDSFQTVFTGVARGCGWQHIVAYVNLGSYYLCGIPVAAALGFWAQLRGMGIYIGILTGAFTQRIILAVVVSYTDWEMQAKKARNRLFDEKLLVDG